MIGINLCCAVHVCIGFHIGELIGNICFVLNCLFVFDRTDVLPLLLLKYCMNGIYLNLCSICHQIKVLKQYFVLSFIQSNIKAT